MKKIIYIAIALFLSVSVFAQVDRSVQPKPGPAPKVNIIKPKSFKLANGLEVLVVENHKLPQVIVALGFDNPPSVEGAIKGVDELAGAMLGNGTTKLSKDEFNEQLEYYGANIHFGLNDITGKTLSRFLPEVISLMAQGVLEPSFTEVEFKSERAKFLDAIKIEEKSAKHIAGNVRKALIYGKNHPKGEMFTEESIKKVNLSDVKGYYGKYFVPSKAYLVIIGDVNFDEVKKLVTDNFSSWKKGEAPKSVYTEPVNLATTEIDFVDVPNAVQTEISVNVVTNLKMTDSDYFAALLANYILGGSSDSYLFKNLRETHGWTYGAYSSIDANKYTSDICISASVRSAAADSSLVEMMKEVKRIRTQKPTQEELDLAKAKFIGSFVMNAEKPNSVVNFTLRERTQSLPANFYENYIQSISAVTLDQIQAAANRYFSDEKARIVIAGKASEILPSLEKLNIPIKYYDRYANAVSKPEAKKVSSDVSVKSILMKYIDAIGGEAVLNKVKTIEITSVATVQGQQMTIVKKEAFNKSFQSMSVMGMLLAKTVFNGKTGYMEVQGKKKEMDAEEIASQKNLAPFPELLMLKSDDIKLAGIEKINDVDAYKLVEGPYSYFYDVNTGLKVAESKAMKNPAGEEAIQVVNFGDYKEIDGIKIPYLSTMNIGMEIDLKVTDVKINEDVTDADFE